MSLQGYTIGKYRVLDPLGRGGMARVYRAYHPQLNRYVALKVLRGDLVEDDEFLARFQREAQAIAALRHAHIVQVHDFDAQDDVYYMVMELLEGDTLKARLNGYRQRDERMPPGEMGRVLLDVLDGLAYAHSEGMVHRDIKPANIMLTKRGQAVITDFGIAQIIGGTRYTMSGALMGTLNYMAPEQGLTGQCDARCDIYSLGIVLYEMLTQSVPFDADTPLAILMKHLNDPLPLPRQVVPTIPQSLEQIVLTALAKQPDDRYANASEMAQALQVAMEETGVELPERISLPVSFATAEAPSESVAVLSGTARAGIADVQFAKHETDVTLGERLAVERAAHDAVRSATTNKMPSRSKRARADGGPQATLPNGSAVESVLGTMGHLVALIVSGATKIAPDIAHFLTAETRGRTARAILSGVGVVVIYNLLAVWIGGLTGSWGLYVHGWPIEFLVASLGLCIVTYALSSQWLLIPAGILLGNGLLFSYCQITGNWAHWAFLWPLELGTVGASIWLPIWLSKQGSTSRQLSQSLGCALGVIAAIWSLVVGLAAISIGLVARLIG